MPGSSSAPIQVVARAVELLRALNRQPVSTLDALHRQTGIPKPSLVRLLQTLGSLGLVRPAPKYGAYQLTSGVMLLASGWHGTPRIVDAAAAHADALTRELAWPVSVAVHDVDAMVVRYSTIPSSPLSFFHSTIGMRLSLLSLAMGRAWLAFCEPPAQQALVDLLLRAGSEEDRLAGDAAAIARTLAGVRERGYALRDARVRPESSTLAVPVFDGGRVVASLGLTWFTSALSEAAAVGRFLAPLQRASSAVSLALATPPSVPSAVAPSVAPSVPPHGKS